VEKPDLKNLFYYMHCKISNECFWTLNFDIIYMYCTALDIFMYVCLFTHCFIQPQDE